MWRCRLVDVLDRLVPLKVWRGFLIARHRERCPRCQAGLASREEVRRLLVRAEDIAPGLDLWPTVRSAIVRGVRMPKPAAAPRPIWKSVLSFAGAVLLAVFVLWFVRSGISVRTSPSATEAPQDSRIKINYIRVGGEPATAYIYQPSGADLVVVWAGKNP
jgi:hypothetical protein